MAATCLSGFTFAHFSCSAVLLELQNTYSRPLAPTSLHPVESGPRMTTTEAAHSCILVPPLEHTHMRQSISTAFKSTSASGSSHASMVALRLQEPQRHVPRSIRVPRSCHALLFIFAYSNMPGSPPYLYSGITHFKFTLNSNGHRTWL